jgi:hypothetical protein
VATFFHTQQVDSPHPGQRVVVSEMRPYFHRHIPGLCTTAKRGIHRLKQVVHRPLWTTALQILTA